jgi:hypothetical protein
MAETKKAAPTKVITGRVRICFLQLFEPKAMEGSSDEKYSVMLLIPKSDTETLKKIKNAQNAALQQGLNSKFGGKKPANLKTTLRDGDEEMDTEERPEFKGMMFMNVSSKTRPGVVDKNLNQITDSNDIHSGDYARVSLNFYAYNTAGNKGITAGLNNVQKVADGEYLGGRSRAEDEFDEWEDDDFVDVTDDEDMPW